MFAADNPQIQELFDASARDMRTIGWPVDDEVFGFHAQQAAEKLYKALITAHGNKHVFTHNLEQLIDHISLLGETVPSLPIDLAELSAYGVEFRYQSGRAFDTAEREAMKAALIRLDSYVRGRAEELKRARTLVKNP